MTISTLKATQLSRAAHCTLRHPDYPKLHIFQRESGNWFAGFQKDGFYVRRSMRTGSLEKALILAKDWYIKQEAKITLGQFEPTTRRTLRIAAKSAMENLKGKVDRREKSHTYMRGIETLLSADILPFFGSTNVTDIGPARWRQYVTHMRTSRPQLSRGTLHQHRNALRLCLNEAVQREWIDRLPVLKLDGATKKDTLPRTWFEPDEYNRLLRFARRHITQLANTRWSADAIECHNFILWMANTGMRVGEARNVRFCDVEVCHEKDNNQLAYCLIKNIRGKRGTGECRSWYGAPAAFHRLVTLRQIDDPSTSTQKLFRAHHRDMFNQILNDAGLKYTKSTPPQRRDFVSLRHTYIALRLTNGASVYDIANNCRTSVAMIERHYARFLKARYLNGINASTSKWTTA